MTGDSLVPRQESDMVPSQQTGVSNKIEVIKWFLDSPFPYDNERDLWFIHLELLVAPDIINRP